MTTDPTTDLQQRALALRLNGLLAHWGEPGAAPWIGPLLAWEEAERARRSLERRMRRAAIGSFKPLADFDWTWPTRCNGTAIEEPSSMK